MAERRRVVLAVEWQDAPVVLEEWLEHGCWYEPARPDQHGALYAPAYADGREPTAADVGEIIDTYAEATGTACVLCGEPAAFEADGRPVCGKGDA